MRTDLLCILVAKVVPLLPRSALYVLDIRWPGFADIPKTFSATFQWIHRICVICCVSYICISSYGGDIAGRIAPILISLFSGSTIRRSAVGDVKFGPFAALCAAFVQVMAQGQHGPVVARRSRASQVVRVLGLAFPLSMAVFFARSRSRFSLREIQNLIW